MRQLIVKEHTLKRWKERVGTDVDKQYIGQLFRNNVYTIIEPAKQGRLIVHIKGYVFVISKTNARTIVHTVYGTFDTYELKRPYAVNNFYKSDIIKWEKHQKIGRKKGRVL